MQIVDVKCSKNYKVIIENGIFTDLVKYIGNEKTCFVTDENVYRIYKEKIYEHINKMYQDVLVYVVKPGETSKSSKTYIELLEYLAKNKFTRADTLIALGGGVVGDLTGFVAATYLRGIEFIQVPTTVLAASDSSVGGKTAINLDYGKNLVGAFYQPKTVLVDPEFFLTLPQNIKRDGFAEIIKYGIINKPSLFEELDSADNLNYESIIKASLESKAKLVEEDEYDKGSRMLLNLGHTFGHSIEIAGDYKYTHGEAVAMGIHMISKAAMLKGFLKASDYEKIKELLIKFGFKLDVEYDENVLYEIMELDKKRSDNTIKLIIPFAIGDTRIIEITMGELKEYLKLALS